MFQGRNGKILQTKKKKWEIDLGKNRCLDISGHILGCPWKLVTS